jgi:hypothetical protein
MIMAKAKIRGFVFYKGPSMLDGKPIVAILTGLMASSNNEKTGKGLFQTWILPEDINPLHAIHTGADASICGDCKHRGTIGLVTRGKHKGKVRNKGRSCYVRLDTAPNNIWKSFHRGIYPCLPVNAIRELVAGAKIRGGSYGDPAAVPYHVWQALLDNCEPGTAYTHQWRLFPELAAFCMASVDSAEERIHAKLLGFRTFRVRGESESLQSSEIACPASEEMGHRTTCDLCKACGGHAAKARVDIAIIAHGAGLGHFMPAEAA